MENSLRLPDEMLTDFLIYLPIRSLMRFKCVSKHWYTIIKSSSFVTKHLKRDCNNTLLVKRYLPPPDSNNDNVYQPGGADVLSSHDPDSPDLLLSPSVTIPFLDDVHARFQVEFKGACNGLVCIISNDIIVLCNPALREFKLIETGPFACPEHYIDLIYGSGFGFDANSNSYKVMQMWQVNERAADYYDHDEYMRIDLYNSSTDSWKLIDIDVPPIRYDPGFDVLFNGKCHWQANEFIEGPPAMAIILSFDLSTEEFDQFEFPDWFNDEKNSGLIVVDECLAVIRYSEWIEEPYLMDIWVMKEYGVKESWTEEYVIGPYLFRLCLLCWENERLFVENMNGQLQSCGIHSDEIKRFHFYGYEGSFRALMYTESIISLDQLIKSGQKENKSNGA